MPDSSLWDEQLVQGESDKVYGAEARSACGTPAAPGVPHAGTGTVDYM